MKKVFLENMGIDGFGQVYIAPVNGYEVIYDGQFLGNDFAQKGKDVSANIIHSHIHAAWQYEGEELDESKFTINKYQAYVVWQEVCPGGYGHAQYVLGGGLNKLKNKKVLGKGPGSCHDEALAYNLGKSDKKPTAFNLAELIGEHEVVNA